MADVQHGSSNRRSQPRGERTRGKLLLAARDLFARRGYEGTSIGDVAARAGVGVGTVYHHFADKRALLLAILDHLESRAFGGDEERGGLGFALEEEDVARALQALVRIMIELRRSHPTIYPSAVELGRRDAEVAARCQQIERRAYERLRLSIGHGQELGKLREDVDADSAALVVVQSVFATVACAADEPTEARREAFARELATMLSRYLLA